MQVVYVGGSTPTPSPRNPRKQYQGYGRPILPGYSFPIKHGSPQKSKSKDRQESSKGETNFRDSIPAMSTPVAVTCLICNILIPGLGTFISGLTVLCCSRMRLKENTKSKVILVNCWVALLQLLTSFLLLLGWIWSILWATTFLSYTDDYYKILQNEKNKPAPDKRKESPVKHTPSPKQRNGAASTSSASLEAATQQSLLQGTTSSEQQQIIKLQELPSINNTEVDQPVNRPIMNARTRHQKILRRQMSDNDLSPFNLTQEQLEEIVIHAAPVTRASRIEELSEAGPSNTEKG